MTLAGVFYIGFPSGFLVAIRNAEPNGIIWLLAIFSTTWSTDTFAYLGGRLFGKHKLAPRLSPKKTIEGALIGVLFGFGITLVLLAATDLLNSTTLLLILLAPFVAIAGDLFESALKRYFKVKDSFVQGLNVFPGHGGVLDRVDAMLWVTVIYFIMLRSANLLIT